MMTGDSSHGACCAGPGWFLQARELVQSLHHLGMAAAADEACAAAVYKHVQHKLHTLTTGWAAEGRGEVRKWCSCLHLLLALSHSDPSDAPPAPPTCRTFSLLSPPPAARATC